MIQSIKADELKIHFGITISPYEKLRNLSCNEFDAIGLEAPAKHTFMFVEIVDSYCCC